LISPNWRSACSTVSMLNQTSSSILSSIGHAKESSSASPLRTFPKKKQRVLSLPGLTGPILLVHSPRVKAAPKRTIWCDVLSLTVDILDLRSWRNMDPVAGFLLAAYVAVVAQPLVYGGLGTSIVALMTPVK
jgi:hypothetical protein